MTQSAIVTTRHKFGCLGWAVIITLVGPLLLFGACAAITALGIGITAAAGPPTPALEEEVAPDDLPR